MSITPLTRFFSCCLLALLICASPVFAEDETPAGTLSPELEKALSALLAAAPQGKPAPPEAEITTVLAFVTDNTTPASKVIPQARDEGLGAYKKDSLNLPLKKILSYTMNPAIPGEAIYPSSVRRNTWYPESEILKNSETFLKATYPPATPLVLHGVEYEETTPDTSSGCYYAYKLNRLFILTAYEGRTALLSVSSMPDQSTVGRRGAIVGNDKNWDYVYTPDQGTNLPMLGWAETYLYGSASISVFIESAPGSSKTDIYLFKWAKAGWSGMNVVKRSHILAGLTRFTDGLRQVLEHPKAPSVSALAKRFTTLRGLKEDELRAQLNDYAAHLENLSKNDSLLSGKDFQKVLKDGAYPATFGRSEAISELMKLYVRQQLGMSAPASAPKKDTAEESVPQKADGASQ